MTRSWTKGAVGLALALAGIGLVGASPAARADEAADLQAGRELARVHCSRCHAIGDQGSSPMPEAPPFRDLKLRYPVDDLAEALAEGIVTGHPQMPEFTFSPQEIDAFLAYLDSLR
jgi:mono/diheme cytochrome c family protein